MPCKYCDGETTDDTPGCPMCRDDECGPYCNECLRHHLEYHCVIPERQDDECSDGEDGCLEMSVDDDDTNVPDLAIPTELDPESACSEEDAGVSTRWRQDPITSRLVRIP
jgi:hypothetical protein